MSFLGGPECSTSSNPLSQLQKHTQADNALQRNRVVATGPGAAAVALAGFRSAAAPGVHDQAMKGFLGGMPGLQHNGPPNLLSAPAPSEALMRPDALAPQGFEPGWMPMDASATLLPPLTGTPFSAEEFAGFRSTTQYNPASSSQMHHALPSAASAHMQMHRPMMGMGMVAPGLGFGALAHQPLQHQPSQHQQPQQVEGKGKGRAVVELDDHTWEEQFAELDKEGDLVDQLDKAMHSETNSGDFESIWKGIQAEAAANKDFDVAGLDDDLNTQFPEFSEPGRFQDLFAEQYLFEMDNMFEKRQDAFEEGVRIMKGGGNLSLAALAFEAAVQQRPDHTEAWVHLGSAQAQNEKETASIRAHEQALKLDPTNLAALMGLAVSYINEGYEAKAYRSLERWLSSKYPQVVQPPAVNPAADLGYTDRAELHSRVTESFIRAAQLSPDGEHMDPDVQVGLGVLFYGDEQYDKAVDCFQSALASSEIGTVNQRDQVHLLWNRLGATLANSGRPEEAVSAYQNALSLNPNFVRARYNLGVSCININCYQEAASHLLAALELHNSIAKSGRNRAYEILAGGSGAAPGDPAVDAQLDRIMSMNMSTTLYDTLRRVFSLMGRRDLADKTVAGVDPAIFRGEFDF